MSEGGQTFLMEALRHRAALSPWGWGWVGTRAQMTLCLHPSPGPAGPQNLQGDRWPFIRQVSPGALLSLTLSKMDSPPETHPVFLVEFN